MEIIYRLNETVLKKIIISQILLNLNLIRDFYPSFIPI